MSPAGWREARLTERRDWATGLRTIHLDLSLAFAAGQFVNLALDLEEGRVSRSYSMASAPQTPAEFYLTEVPGGALTPSLFALEVGDAVWVNPLPAGHFTLERVPDAQVLWLMATGTGLGPYIAMLRTPEPWRRFERLVVAHGVRVPEHLGYRDELARLSADHDGRLTWVPVCSRAPTAEGVVQGRVTTALEAGTLEAAAGLELQPQTSQVLLCGNPAMVDDMRRLLGERGLNRNRRRAPGHVTAEKYWG